MGRKRKPLLELDVNDSPLSNKKSKSDDNDDSIEIGSKRRAGTLLRIVLKNFMCHSLLDVDLTSMVNVLIGRNGSGKSAILTALIVGLGGKATLTNRGSSVQSFVKLGQSSATIEIYIYNGGPMAYRPNIYGNQIVVCRHFRANGGGHYRIKSAKGEVVSTQVREIRNITMSLNIQVDNPVCILNQDTSRTFLNSNDPKHKFELFMKATKLDVLEREYQNMRINRANSRRQFEEKKLEYEKLKKEFMLLEEKIKNHRSIVSIGCKIKENQVEMLWAKVRDYEEDVKKEEYALHDLENKYSKAINDCASRADKVKAIKEKIDALNQQVHELKETIQVQTRPQHDVKRVLEELRQKFNDRKSKKQQILTTIEIKTKDLKVLEKEIENANKNMSRVEQEKLQRLHDLNAMSDKLKALDEHLQTCRNDLFQISSDIRTKDEDKQNLKREIASIDQQISHYKSNLNALKSESGNTLMVYGREMPRIVEMIEQNKHKFSKMPKGPIGSYIKMKNKKWAIAIESHLQALLGSFCVDNPEDNKILQAIFAHVCTGNRKPTVITSKFITKKHDVQNHLVRAPSDCVSLYDAIEIDDAVVANCVVDQMAIEGILLIPSDERAIELMSQGENVPVNCLEGITMKGDKYYPDPNYRTYGSRYHQAKFLQVDTKEHMMQLQDAISRLTEKREALLVQLRILSKETATVESKKNELESKANKLSTAKAAVKHQLDLLEYSAEPEVANVNFLESELNEIRNVLHEKEAQLAGIDEALQEIKEEIKVNESKLRQLQEANSSLDDRMRSLESQIREETTIQREIATSDHFDKSRVRDLEIKVTHCKNSLIQKRSAVATYIEEAALVGERPAQLSRSVREIMEEITALERNVNRIKSNTEDLETIKQKYQLILNKQVVVDKCLNAIAENIKELTEAINIRSKHWEVTKNYFVTLMKRDFKAFLASRNFEGSIRVNIPEKKLDLLVIPQKGSQTVTVTSNLSGGERSFSTVAFLHALWQCMDFPFYFLDEFDVFMDKMNRTVVFEILISHAQEHKDIQFVFLTPQDISFLKNNVTILRLADPERLPV